MKLSKVLLALLLLINVVAFGQTYTMPTGTGNQNVSTCSGNFFDSGGAGGNYSTNANSTITFCPGTPGQLIRIVFSSYNTENLSDGATLYDFLEIHNGPSIASPLLTTMATDFNAPITFESSDVSGCLTFHFVSDGSLQQAGWAGVISCFLPCVPPTSNVTATGFPAAPAQICPGTNVSFSGAASTPGAGFSIANYSWDFGDGSPLGTGANVNHTYNDIGIYYVNLTVTDNNGCVNNNLTKYEINISPPTFFNGTAAADNQLCLGESTTITGVPTPQIFQEEPLSFIAGELYLPDGDNAGYNAQITYQEFAPGATVTNINQILDIWANLEHTYLGDLAIEIICPNGSSVGLHNADQTFDAAQSQSLGNPIATDGTGPGTGFNYSWPTTGATVTLANAAGNPRPAGSYLAEEAFTPLIGCPLNGTWTLYILDTELQDDGYIFNWGINFDPSLYNLQTLAPVNVTTVWTADPSITNTAGNTITVQPTTTGTHTYTFTATNDYGCTFDTTITINVNPLPVANAGTSGQTCSGVNYNLGAAATAGNTYAWLPAANLSSTTIANPVYNQTIPGPGSVTTTYTLTQTITATGCTDTSQVVVTVSPTPTITVNSPTICVGTTTLTATGATNYTWSAGATSITPSGDQATVAPAATAQYTVTGSIGTCTATAVSTVTVNNNTPAPTTAPLNYCQNVTSTPLSATPSAGGLLNWYGTNATGGTASATAPTPPTTTVGPTTYYVSQSIGGCEGPREPLVVTVNSLPPATAVNTGPYCAGATINLSSSGGTGYSWAGPNTYSNATQNPTITNSTTAMTGVYTVTVTDANNCVATATTSVTVNALPTPSANNDGPYCENATINLTSSGGVNYAWTGPSAFVNGTQNPSIVTATLAMAGNYIVTVTDANLCVATATTTIVVNTLPVATVSNTGPYCANQNINLSCSLAGVSYSWTGPDLYASATQNPSLINSTTTMAGNYLLTVTDANLCQSSYTTTVVVNPLPVVNIGSNSPVCENGTIDLTSGGGNLYSWSGPLVFSSNLQNPSITGATLAMAGNYTVTVTDANNCVNANVTTVSVTPLPAAPITTPVFYCQNASTIPLTATGNGTLNWYGTNSIGGVANPTAPTPVSTSAGLTTYYVSQTVSSCEGPRAPLGVTINPLPTAIINPIIGGCAPICRDFFLNSSSNLINYTWNLGNGIFIGNDTVTQHCYSEPGTYNVSVLITDNNGCFDTMHFNNWVEVYEVPIAEFTFGPDKISVLEPEINFVDLSVGSNIVFYSWQFGDPLLSTSGDVNPTFAYTDVGVYDVTHIVMNDKGCRDTVIHPVTIPQDWAIYVPNAFSPNDDGINDYFHPSGIGLDEKTYNLWIYDRWGNMIFYTKDWNTFWDGKVQGHSNIVQEDTYIWKINVKSFNGKKYFDTGHVHVVR
jgi:gliding motility-associated-like protein